MNKSNPTQKILTIVASAVIILSFFLPWVATFGQTVSAAKAIEQIAEALKYIDQLQDEQKLYLLIPISLLVMPICSFIILITTSTSPKSRPMPFPKILMAIVMTIYFGFLIYEESKNPFSSHGGSIFSMLGIGFYLTFLNVIYLFVTVFLKEKVIIKNVNNANFDVQLYCSGCGKSYNPSNAGKFCTKCGTKL